MNQMKLNTLTFMGVEAIFLELIGTAHEACVIFILTLWVANFIVLASFVRMPKPQAHVSAPLLGGT